MTRSLSCAAWSLSFLASLPLWEIPQDLYVDWASSDARVRRLAMSHAVDHTLDQEPVLKTLASHPSRSLSRVRNVLRTGFRIGGRNGPSLICIDLL